MLSTTLKEQNKLELSDLWSRWAQIPPQDLLETTTLTPILLSSCQDFALLYSFWFYQRAFCLPQEISLPNPKLPIQAIPGALSSTGNFSCLGLLGSHNVLNCPRLAPLSHFPRFSSICFLKYHHKTFPHSSTWCFDIQRNKLNSLFLARIHHSSKP